MSYFVYRLKNARIASLTVSPRSSARTFAARQSSSSTRIARVGLSARGWSGIGRRGSTREGAPALNVLAASATERHSAGIATGVLDLSLSHTERLAGVDTPVNTPGCWDACLLACHHDLFDDMCDAHYDELVGGAQ